MVYFFEFIFSSISVLFRRGSVVSLRAVVNKIHLVRCPSCVGLFYFIFWRYVISESGFVCACFFYFDFIAVSSLVIFSKKFSENGLSIILLYSTVFPLDRTAETATAAAGSIPSGENLVAVNYSQVLTTYLVIG